MNLSFPRKGKGLRVNTGWSLKGLLLKERAWTRVQGELKEAAGWLQAGCRLASRALTPCISRTFSRSQAAR